MQGKGGITMDDLISRSQMSEAIKDYLKGLIDKGIHEVDITEFNVDVQNIIEAQPTSYNVDKVVEQLDANAQKMSEAKVIRPYAKSSPADHRYYKAISVKKAKEIVKAGGVNG